jgi:hypothetical protein
MVTLTSGRANGLNIIIIIITVILLGAPKFAEQLNGAMSTHVRK